MTNIDKDTIKVGFKLWLLGSCLIFPMSWYAWGPEKAGIIVAGFLVLLIFQFFGMKITE